MDRERRAAIDHGRARRRDFRTVRVLGIGSKAAVKLAVRLSDGRELALKSIRKPGRHADGDSAASGSPQRPAHAGPHGGASDSAGDYAALEREWRTEVRALEIVGQHENMPELIEAFETSSKWYIALEFQRGGDLFSRLAVMGQFTELHASAVIATIVNAVHFLHAHGIAHRDLKPANLLMKDESENSNLCLVDFGAGFVMDRTPFYLAPEIVVGMSYTTKVDMWSLGCIAYQLLVGVTPFQSSVSFEQLYHRIVTADYAFPDDIPLSDLAKDFVSSLLVADPNRRFSAGQAMRHPWI
ncbi:kinase-like domain-containing protein, partial [Hyaloraphidium curvatum]